MISNTTQNFAGKEKIAKTINFNYDKADIIDYVFSRCDPKPKSFADLGGVWGVDGAYTLYTLSKHYVERAYLVDAHFNDRVSEAARTFKNLNCLEGNFGDTAVAAKVGKVDAVFMFDILLHQVSPNWDDVMAMYAEQTNYLIILNQQWPRNKTIRLLDLGLDTYVRTVPGALNHPVYNALYDNLDEIHPQHNRPWRDVHHIWQWGIIDEDLIKAANNLGFRMLYYKDCGFFPNSNIFRNRAFVFQKK